jgi:multiple sugar transport system permease protein
MKLRAALLLILPAGAFFLLSFAIPMVLVGRLAFFATDYLKYEYVGVRNFLEAVRDPYFLRSFANVGWFVLMIAPAGILLPYLVAMFLQGFSRRLQSVGRFACYVPSLTSGLVMGLLWQWLLMRNGLINQFLTAWGLSAIPWTGQPWPARVAVAMAALSAGPGTFVILFSAAMMAIPRELHEAAIIDGATERQYQRYVVRPLLMPTVLLALMLTIVGTMQSWESIYVLFASGGPRGAAATPVYEIFLTAFQYGRAGYAAAKGLLLLVVIAAIVVVKQRIERWVGAER